MGVGVGGGGGGESDEWRRHRIYIIEWTAFGSNLYTPGMLVISNVC